MQRQKRKGENLFFFAYVFFFYIRVLFACLSPKPTASAPVECEMLHSADKTRSLLILLDVETTSEDAGRDVLLG